MAKKKKGIGFLPLAAMGSLDPKTKGIVAVGGLLIGGYLVVQVVSGAKGLLEALGLKDSKEDKEEDRLIENASKYPQFNPNYWWEGSSTAAKKWLVYKDESAKTAAKKIKNAWGVFDDDEAAVTGVFRNARSKAHVSRIADAYFKLYSIGLFDDLKARLSSTELSDVIRITENLPAKVYQ